MHLKSVMLSVVMPSVVMLSVVMLSVMASFVQLKGKGFTFEQSAQIEQVLTAFNGTARFNNVNNCLYTNIYSYLETSGGQSFILYFNAVIFFNTSVN